MFQTIPTLSRTMEFFHTLWVLLVPPLATYFRALATITTAIRPNVGIRFIHWTTAIAVSLSEGMVRTWRQTIPVQALLVGSVSHILQLSSYEQMGGIHAWRVVASMTNILSTWYRTVMQFPRNPVGGLSALGSFFLTANTNVAITGRAPIADPKPTTGRALSSVHAAPKTFIQGFHFANHPRERYIHCSISPFITLATRA